VLFETIVGPGLELFECPTCLGDADHGNIEVAPLQHRLQRGKDLLVSEITRCAEKHQRVRPRFAHVAPVLSPPDFSRCPPNSYRIAESSLF
jgi:hypothetical protein